MPEHVVVILGDAGATDYFLAAYPTLSKKYALDIVADPAGAAADKLSKSGVPHISLPALSESFLKGASLVLCGTAGKAQGLWKHTSVLAQSAGIPCAWFCDFFGSGCEAAVKDISPDHIAFFDASSREQFLAERPLFRGRMNIVGNPSYDMIAKFDTYAHRVEVRERLGVKSAAKLVVYSASSLKQFDLMESMRVLVSWAREIDVLVGVSFHPADEKSASAEVAQVKEYLARKLGPSLIDLQNVRGLPLAAAADVFITDYSTEGVRACLMGTPTAFLLLPSAAKYQQSRGGAYPFFPILDCSKGKLAALGIYASSDAPKLSSLLLTEAAKAEVRSALQQLRFRTLADGKATRRFVEFVDSCMQ